MLDSTEEKLEVVKELARRLDAIRTSKEVQEFIANIKHEAENSGMEVKFKSRIKENESAIDKYKKHIERDGKADPEMRDSCGMMTVVDNIEEVYKFVEFFRDKLSLRNNGVRDYVQTPKAGYRSVHMYTTFLTDGMTVPSEIQIKTEAMSIAQDTIHDSIYKRQSMPVETRNQLSAALFPIFEKSADADRAESRGDFETATRLRAEVVAIRSQNAQLFSENREAVNNTWKEYAKVLFTHHNLGQIQGGFLLKKPTLTKEDKTEMSKQLNEALEKLFAYYFQNVDETLDCPSVSGDRSIDYVIRRLGSMGHSEFIEELKNIVTPELKQGQEKVEVASVGDFAQIDSSVSPESRREMSSEVSREISLLNRDQTQDKGRA